MDLDELRPAALDARAPETTLSGKASVLVGTGFAAAKAEARTVSLVADVSGPLEDHRLPHAAPRLARLHIDARGNGRKVELRSAEATLGKARAIALRPRDAQREWCALARRSAATPRSPISTRRHPLRPVPSIRCCHAASTVST